AARRNETVRRADVLPVGEEHVVPAYEIDREARRLVGHARVDRGDPRLAVARVRVDVGLHARRPVRLAEPARAGDVEEEVRAGTERGELGLRPAVERAV